jgi:hypothetical protein
MTDALKSIFGGGSAQQQSSSTPIDMQDPAYKALRGTLADTLTQLLQSGGGPTYSGPLSAPITATETNDLADTNSMVGTGTQRNQYLNDVIAGKYLPGQPGANPFFDAAVKAAQRPTLEGLTETLTRDLPGRFTQGGQFIQSNTADNGGSSAFDRAAAIATRGAANAIGDIATNMGNQQFQNERTNQQQAVPLQQAEVDKSISNLNAQALPRLIQELGIERGMQLFQQRTTNLLSILQTIAGVAAPVVANQSQSTAESDTEKGIFPALFPKGA